MNEFLAAHPTGEPGDTYLVGGRLQAWDDDAKRWNDLGSLIGPTGPQGDRGPIAATIPFAISSSTYGQGAEISTNLQGEPEIVGFAGFGVIGSSSPAHVQEGQWNSGSIAIDEMTNYPNSFVMPYDGTLKNIYVIVANRSPLYIGEGVTMRPFVCITISDGKSLVFKIITETITYTEPYVKGEEDEIPKYGLRSGSKVDLNVKLAKGSLVGIVVGWVGEGTTMQMQTMISASGGLFIE